MKDKILLIQNGVNVEKSLDLFGDMAMYNESLGDFMGEISNKLYKISHFKEMSDMANYAILVHSLKTDAKYFGFEKLAELAYNHELQSKDKNVIYINEHYRELITESERIVALVKKYLSGAKASSNEGDSLPQNSEEKISFIPTDSCKKSLLVVDDSDIIKKFVEKIFIDEYNVLLASDGNEAINFIKQNSKHNIAAMLLDLNMPVADGFKVLEFMNQNNLFQIIPVSIITGNDSREINLNAFTYPIVDILPKPFREDSAREIVNKTINFRR